MTTLEQEATMPHIPTAHEIETFTGLYVDLVDPQPETITLTDVAYGLSNTCRYNGQVPFYSVAEHAVAVSVRMEVQGWDKVMCLLALHHDDAEAYLGDVTRPLKSLLQPAYGMLSEQMDYAIQRALNLPVQGDYLAHAAIKEADNWALLREARVLLPSKGEYWAGNGACWDLNAEGVDTAEGWYPEKLPPTQAQGLYLSRHWELV